MIAICVMQCTPRWVLRQTQPFSRNANVYLQPPSAPRILLRLLYMWIGTKEKHASIKSRQKQSSCFVLREYSVAFITVF